jgi:hypothetical protein
MQTIRGLTCSFLLVVGLLAWVVPALATTVLDESLADLVHQADVIAIGTVTGIQEQWDATHQAPITQVTFSNLTVLKGQAGPDSMTLDFLGGHFPDGRMLTVTGMPQFTIGEKPVVFSVGNQQYFCPLVGMWQGLLRVTFDPQRGEEIVSDNFHRPIAGLQDGKFATVQPEVTAQEPLSLPALMDLITQEMGNPYGPQ